MRQGTIVHYVCKYIYETILYITLKTNLAVLEVNKLTVNNVFVLFFFFFHAPADKRLLFLSIERN